MVDDSGRIVSADGSATTEKTQTQRTGPIDIAPGGEGLRGARQGQQGRRRRLSAQRGAHDDRVARTWPSTTAVRAGGGARSSGPWCRTAQVWRTGANAATTFFIDHAVAIGDVVVPAGGYTLWTLPTADGVELIINRQTRQWGTEYDSDQDLTRVPMRIATGSTPLENFTIAIVPHRGRQRRAADPVGYLRVERSADAPDGRSTRTSKSSAPSIDIPPARDSCRSRRVERRFGERRPRGCPVAGMKNGGARLSSGAAVLPLSSSLTRRTSRARGRHRLRGGA